MTQDPNGVTNGGSQPAISGHPDSLAERRRRHIDDLINRIRESADKLAADGTSRGDLKLLSRAIAESDAFSLAGGGDTLAAIDKFGIADKVSYISTGGGAFLEYVEGKTLPAVQALVDRAAD